MIGKGYSQFITVLGGVTDEIKRMKVDSRSSRHHRQFEETFIGERLQLQLVTVVDTLPFLKILVD